MGVPHVIIHFSWGIFHEINYPCVDISMKKPLMATEFPLQLRAEAVGSKGRPKGAGTSRCLEHLGKNPWKTYGKPIEIVGLPFKSGDSNHRYVNKYFLEGPKVQLVLS